MSATQTETGVPKKPLFTKKELSAVKPGTWITLAWNDVPDETVLLLEKINTNERGDCQVRYLNPSSGCISHAVHTQIVGVHYTLVVPAPFRQYKSSSRLGTGFN